MHLQGLCVCAKLLRSCLSVIPWAIVVHQTPKISEGHVYR